MTGTKHSRLVEFVKERYASGGSKLVLRRFESVIKLEAETRKRVRPRTVRERRPPRGSILNCIECTQGGAA